MIVLDDRENLPQLPGRIPCVAGEFPSVALPTILKRATYRRDCVSKTLIKGISVLLLSLIGCHCRDTHQCNECDSCFHEYFLGAFDVPIGKEGRSKALDSDVAPCRGSQGIRMSRTLLRKFPRNTPRNDRSLAESVA